MPFFILCILSSYVTHLDYLYWLWCTNACIITILLTLPPGLLNTWELILWYLLGKCLELFSNSLFSPAVPNLLFLFFTVQWVFNFMTIFITRLFLSNLFFSCVLYFLWVFNSFLFAFNHINHNSLVFSILICFLKFLGTVHDPVDLLWTRSGGMLSRQCSGSFDS